MRFRTGLIAAILFASAAPAMAATCNEPVVPTIAVMGATASEAQMRAAIGQFKTFQAAADAYEACVNDAVKDLREQAKLATPPKPVDPSVQSAYAAKIEQIQAEKETLGTQLNAQIIAYKQAHPAKP